VSTFARQTQSPSAHGYLVSGTPRAPTDAITLSPRISGQWYTASTRHGPLASAELYPGEETSGKLVTLVKQKAHTLAKEVNAEQLIIDGSPGIGCPVIASATGASAVILVTEPSLSGLHDLERILGVVTHFRIPAYRTHPLRPSSSAANDRRKECG